MMPNAFLELPELIRLIIIYHHLSLFIIIYHDLSLFIIIYHYLSLFIIIYHYLSLFIIIYHYLSLFIIIRYHISSSIITYAHLSSLIISYHHLWSFMTSYQHVSSMYHWSSFICVLFCSNVFLPGSTFGRSYLGSTARCCVHIFQRGLVRVAAQKLRSYLVPKKKDAQECFQDGGSKNCCYLMFANV